MPLDAAIPTAIGALLPVLAAVAAIWGVARWLFWPRVRETIHQAVDERLAPVLASLADSIKQQAGATGKLSDALAGIRADMAGQREMVDFLKDRALAESNANATATRRTVRRRAEDR